MPQIYDILMHEHREVEQLLNQIIEGSPDEQQIEHLYRTLETHTHAEEQTLYQDLQETEQTHDIVLEAIEEHHIANMLLKEIRALKPADERVAAKLTVLKENVLHHVQEEEQQMFPKSKQVMDSQWAEKMGHQFHEREHQLKQTMP